MDISKKKSGVAVRLFVLRDSGGLTIRYSFSNPVLLPFGDVGVFDLLHVLVVEQEEWSVGDGAPLGLGIIPGIADDVFPMTPLLLIPVYGAAICCVRGFYFRK